MLKWQYEACLKKVKSKGQKVHRCNMLPCCYQYMGIIGNGVTKNIDTYALSISFLISVENATSWKETIYDNINECERMFFEYVPSKRNVEDYNDFWDCYESIPLYFYNILDCAYSFN